MNTRRDQSGQAFVLTVLFMTALVGMAALVVDLGSWFRQHRQLQATADAAALAGAQELPGSTGDARAYALDYADDNTKDLQSVTVTFSTGVEQDDTIHVHVKKPAPGIFAKVFGVDSVNEGAKASARVGGMQSAKYVAPIVVKSTHPMLNECGGPCLGPGYETTLPVSDTGAPGSFSMLNLLGGSGTAGASELADWIKHGFDEELPIGGYYSAPGVKFNAHDIQEALGVRMNSPTPVMMFPVYDTLSGQGANAEYHIIGWAPFYITGYEAHGNDGSITGYFTEMIWYGTLATSSGGGGPNFGARTVQLIE
ncbi:MAG: pilus assembly protein TadG-related protein [Actinomycetota bacterium]|nr:pilus assembly protein TadG-related protein [Actinomycetota bacterium]